MLRIIVPALAYLVVVGPVGWLLWHFSAGSPLAVRWVLLAAFALGLVDGRRRRRARKAQTFRDLAG
jgi:hypothetical protein